NSAICLPSSAFQSFAELLVPAEANRFPSARAARARTGPPLLMIFTGSDFSMAQSRMVPSRPPDNNWAGPCEVAARAVTAPSCPLGPCSRARPPLDLRASSQTLTTPSAPPLPILLSASQTTALISEERLVWASSLPSAADQTRSDLSAEAEASLVPSREKAR